MYHLCQTFNMKQLVEEPTRVTPQTSTLIDHIYTTMPLRHTTTGVLKWSLSDHY